MTPVCTMPEIMEVMLIINKVIGIIKILVPIVIIITGMNSLFKAVLSSDDKNIKDSVNTLMVKIFVAAAIFFIPTIVNSTIKIVAPNSKYTLCFTVKDKEAIYKAYTASAKESLSKAHNSLKKEDYENASYYISKMPKGSTKNEYEKRLKQINESIKAKNKKNNANGNQKPNTNTNQNSNTNTSVVTNPSSYGDIFVGDSRTLGYTYQISLRSTDAIYATTSGAMQTFNNDFNKALNKINSNPNHRYNLVFNYGVNNPSQDWVNVYKNAINRVGGKANILIVSVNPCNDRIAKYCRNSNIVALNNRLRNAFSSGYSNVRYCDTFTPFVNTPNYTSMIETASGVHYTKTGSTLIYNQIQACLKSFN